MMASCIKDIGQVRSESGSGMEQGCQQTVTCCCHLNQDVVQAQLDEPSQGMSRLIHNQLFLTSMVHALEEQKSFGIKDK